MRGAAMWLAGFVFTCVLVSSSSWTWATDTLYRCADGTFTNRVERQCVPYESKGIVRVQGGTAAKADEGKAPVAEVRRFQRLPGN